MRIEALEPFIHGRDRYETGDRKMVDDALGTYFCKCGWARDLDGKVETAERDVSRRILFYVGAAQHNQTSEEVGNG